MNGAIGAPLSFSGSHRKRHSIALPLAVQPEVLEQGAVEMLTSLPHGGPHMQCLPLQPQFGNVRTCSFGHRTALGTCELTSLRQWRPANAAPPASAPSARRHKSRSDVHCQAALDQSPWDVVALGQSMVDISAYVDDDFIGQMGVAKGGRRYATTLY